MKNDQFIDAVQTIGIVTIAIVLSYVVVRLEGMLSRSAEVAVAKAIAAVHPHQGDPSGRPFLAIGGASAVLGHDRMMVKSKRPHAGGFCAGQRKGAPRRAGGRARSRKLKKGPAPGCGQARSYPAHWGILRAGCVTIFRG